MLPSVLASVAKAAGHLDDLKKLEKAAEAVESNFLKQMLSAMRATVSETKSGGDDTGADTYRDMFDNAIADAMAQKGALGIAKMTFQAGSRTLLNEKIQEKVKQQ